MFEEFKNLVNMENQSQELKVAIESAQKAGAILKDYFEGDIGKELKDDSTFVTVADRESEEIIKNIITQHFPTHSILGEETGLTENDNENVWHVDPVDGTFNFANGIPIFGVSIALERKGEVVVGVVYNPATGSLFYAEKGKGAWLNNKKITVSKEGKETGMLTSGFSKDEKARKLKDAIRTIFPAHFIKTTRNLGCMALELSFLARGGTEVCVQYGLKTYDFAAGTLLVQEAGGVITRLDGSEWKFPDNYFVASNGVFHNELIAEIKKITE
jgi:myo-inositol-1(or 4)-monophosphatase